MQRREGWFNNGFALVAVLGQNLGLKLLKLNNMDFEKWYEEVMRIAKEDYSEDGEWPNTIPKEIWKKWYDDGFSPEKALENESTNW